MNDIILVCVILKCVISINVIFRSLSFSQLDICDCLLYWSVTSPVSSLIWSNTAFVPMLSTAMTNVSWSNTYLAFLFRPYSVPPFLKLLIFPSSSYLQKWQDLILSKTLRLFCWSVQTIGLSPGFLCRCKIKCSIHNLSFTSFIPFSSVWCSHPAIKDAYF